MQNNSSLNFGMQKEEFLRDIFNRRYADYYSWMVEEVNQVGGLMTLGRMAIFGGPHGAGKTTFITELAKFNSISKKTMLIPLEMGTDFTVMMLACNLFNNIRDPDKMKVLGYGELEEGYFYLRSNEEHELFEKCVNDLYENYPNLYIGTPPSLDFEELKTYIATHAKESGIKFFIIDHLHQLDSSQEKDGETAFYSKVAKELKQLAQDLGLSLLCVVQLTKAANSNKSEIDLGSFKGTSEFTSNAHRVAIIKKPNIPPLGRDEAKKQLKEMDQMITSMTIQAMIEDHDDMIRKTTRHVREIIFLKTRGREGGTVTVEMERGMFKFKNLGFFRDRVISSSEDLSTFDDLKENE